jgi:hypothetical protein
VIAACGGGSSPQPTPAPPTLRITNSTPCVIHLRFDNGSDVMRILAGTTRELTDAKLAGYRYAQVESTMAIFRTYNMQNVRTSGYTIEVKPAIGDHDCVEEP